MNFDLEFIPHLSSNFHSLIRVILNCPFLSVKFVFAATIHHRTTVKRSNVFYVWRLNEIRAAFAPFPLRSFPDAHRMQKTHRKCSMILFFWLLARIPFEKL